jgi:hypothetical protein
MIVVVSVGGLDGICVIIVVSVGGTRRDLCDCCRECWGLDGICMIIVVSVGGLDGICVIVVVSVGGTRRDLCDYCTECWGTRPLRASQVHCHKAHAYCV